MAIKFQYNKTSMQLLKRQLKVRQRALPTLQNKESALRLEVKKAKDRAKELDQQYQEQLEQLEQLSRMWVEFDSGLLAIEDVKMSVKKIAGVKTPVLDEVVLNIGEYSLFNSPSWIAEGVKMVRGLTELAFEREFFFRKMEMLDYARKKTTQKVNLYEKVQIPGYESAILKIKRFLEDKDNLSKSAQKIVKKRQEARELAELKEYAEGGGV